jgi:AcrR family transcriptional regulator
VAARLFAKRGYEATSVREIVEAAGVTKPTLYYYFGSKEGLAQALLVVPQARLVKRMRAVVETTEDPRSALAGLLEALFDFCRDDPDRARLMFAVVFGPLGAGLAGEVQNCGRELATIWKRAVGKMVDAGLVERARAEECALAVRGMHIIYILEFLYKSRSLGPELPRRIVNDLLSGFGPKPPRR